MKTLIFDIETNAITDWSTLSDLKTLHCLSIYDIDNTEMSSYSTVAGNIEEGLEKLKNARPRKEMIEFEINKLKILGLRNRVLV